MTFEIKITGEATGTFNEKVKEIADQALNELLALEGSSNVTLTGFTSDDRSFEHFNTNGHGEAVTPEEPGEPPAAALAPENEPEPSTRTAATEPVADPQTTE